MRFARWWSGTDSRRNATALPQGAKNQSRGQQVRCPECWIPLDIEDDWIAGEYQCISCDWHGTTPVDDDGIELPSTYTKEGKQ